MGMKTTALAGPIHRFCVISAGETGKSCRMFPGARPACRGTPETLQTTLGVHFGREPKWLYSRQPWVFGSGENRSDYIVDASGVFG